MFAAALLAASLGLGCRQQPALEESVRTVRAMKVADFSGLAERSFPGSAAAFQEVDLAFRVSGPLIARPVQVGDDVNQGDLIARIDPRDFQVALRGAEGDLQRARANEEQAQTNYDRQLRLIKDNATAQADVDRAIESLEVAKADIAVLEASVDAAKDALEDTDLQAPYAGTIVATHVENFENVRQGQLIARLLDNSRIKFEVNIPETLISLVPFVQDLHVRFDAFPDVNVPAEVNEIGNEASATTRTYPVTLIMDQPEGVRILPGMAGRVSGVVRLPDDEKIKIVIPVTSVFAAESDKKSYVWVIAPASNTVSRRAVQLGELTSGGYVISAGLEPGETIATAGVHFLTEGQQVRPEIQ